MEEKIRKTGIDIIGNAPCWGAHICQFYQTKKDLIDILVPYFKTGLENNEFCIWVTSKPLRVKDAKAALQKAVTNLDNYFKKGQIEILDYSDWYTKSGTFDSGKVLAGWVEKEKEAIKRGFAGLRLTGNTFWLERNNWKDFADYEETVNNVIDQHKMLAICSYSLDKYSPSEIIDVVANHQFALIKGEGKWHFIESSERRKAQERRIEADREKAAYLDAISDGVIVHDLKGNVTAVNPAWEKMHGYKREEVEKLSPQEFLPKIMSPDSIKKAQSIIKATIEKGISGKAELFIHARDGRGFPAWICFSPLKDEKGNIKGMIVSTRDITERKQAEETMKNLAKFPSENPHPVLRIAKDGEVLYSNKAGFEVLDKWKSKIGEKVPKRWRQIITEMFASKSLKEEEEEVNGKTFSFVVAPVAGAGYINLYGTDITERKKAEKALKKSEEELCEDKLALEQKNLALKELIEHMERTKNKTKEDIAINIDESVMPVLKKLRLKGLSPKYVDLLCHHLNELTSSFGRMITQKSPGLSTREIEISNLIKGGLRSKEISELLNISYQTIDKHRRNIRKKLGISKRRANLTSFLQKL